MDRYDVKKSRDKETKSRSRITVKWNDVLCQWKTPLPYICEGNKKLLDDNRIEEETYILQESPPM
jgi:hypothetical protein